MRIQKPCFHATFRIGALRTTPRSDVVICQMLAAGHSRRNMAEVILQGAALNPAIAREAAHLGGAQTFRFPHPTVARLSGVADLQRLEGFGQRHHLDVTHLKCPLRTQDFRVLAMDMDSTLITIECIDEIADRVGVKPQVAAITEAAMRGEIDFPGALRQRVALLAGLDVSALEWVYDERLRLSSGAERLLTFARDSGWKTLLVSGGFTFFADRLKARFGLDFSLANTLEIEGGRLTGRVTGPIIDGDAKAAEVQRVCQILECPTTAAVVLGDGANDLKMMALGGWSVAYHAKPVVQARADMALNFNGFEAVVNLFE